MEEHAKAVCAEPAESGDSAVELRFGCVGGGFCVYCASVLGGSEDCLLREGIKRDGKGDKLLFSNCSTTLSCCLRSFAHFANSS